MVLHYVDLLIKVLTGRCRWFRVFVVAFPPLWLRNIHHRCLDSGYTRLSWWLIKYNKRAERRFNAIMKTFIIKCPRNFNIQSFVCQMPCKVSNADRIRISKSNKLTVYANIATIHKPLTCHEQKCFTRYWILLKGTQDCTHTHTDFYCLTNLRLFDNVFKGLDGCYSLQ